MTPSDEQFRSLAEAAALAPSADNRHRWRLERQGSGLVLEPTQPIAPPGYRRALSLLSLGAVAENIILTATRLGLDAHPTLALSASPGRSPRIDIALTAGASRPDPLWESIPHRHTNRRLAFHGPALSEAQLRELAACATGNTRIQWLDASPARAAAVRLITRAEARRFSDPALHAELFSAIRFDVGWRGAADTGLPPGALEVEAPLRPVFRALRHWRLMSLFNLVGGDRLMGWRAAGLPARLAPHLGVIVSPAADDTGLFDAGRSLERTWLQATAFGLAFHPLPASAVYSLPGHGVSGGLRDALAAGWRDLLADGVPVMVFRLGRAAPPTVTAGRPAAAAAADASASAHP